MAESLHNQRYNKRVALIQAAKQGNTVRVRQLADELDALTEQLQPKPREEKRGRDRRERGGHNRAE